MISDTQMAYGSCVWRHGRSRCARRNQRTRARETACGSGVMRGNLARRPLGAIIASFLPRLTWRILQARLPFPFGGSLSKPAPRVSLAATIVLFRRAPGLEAYWVRRSDALQFLGGFHAFPGGRMSRSDRDVPVRGREGEAAVL